MNFLPANNQKGFTIIETLTAIVLGIIISTILVSVMTTGLRHVSATKSLERLHANAVFLSNTLSYLVKQGENLNVTSPTTLEIRLPDLTIRTVTLDSGRITLDTVPFTSQDVLVNSVTFTQMAKSVRVAFQLESPVSGEILDIRTTVAQRNSR